MSLDKKTDETVKDKLSVLLIEEQPKSSSKLKSALLGFGYEVTKHSSFDINLIEQIDVCHPDILILATDLPSRSLLKTLASINQMFPLPIVIFAENDSPTVILDAIQVGVSAYVVSEVLPQQIKGVISVANERFKAIQALRSELKQTKTQLEGRKVIEKAKGLVMEQKQISESDAYNSLRKMAMDQGRSLVSVAKNIIDVCQLLSTSKT
ncbi:MAG: ANTAR domain-containing protein [Colwellia sp.]